jgi:iron complex outermembrane recepter protein
MLDFKEAFMKQTRLATALLAAFPIALPATLPLRAALGAALFAPLAALADHDKTPQAPVKSLGVVTVTSGQPTSLPTQIPTTMEGVTAEQIEQTVNATDSEDAIKYFPSLLVRKRYVGDYNHAVLSSRASGTGNSARSAVYADGVLLSNYLGNGATYAPRWGLITPEEIDRVDVMYGPFSAAYPGNSVGAIVDYVTRMPTKFEAHAKVSYQHQPFDLYNTSGKFHASQASASLGSKSGDWSWWINANKTSSHGQPLTFVTKAISSTAAGGADKVVTGAVAGLDKSNVPWRILGTGTEYNTTQDHAKVKLAYDISSTLRASYTYGSWQNKSENRAVSYLRDAAGNPVYSGTVNIGGLKYTLGATDFGITNERLNHAMHALSLKSHTQGLWDWELSASRYNYGTDEVRAPTTAIPGSYTGGAGTITIQGGTGWGSVAAKGTWRPQGIKGEHIVDFGAQQDNYTLRILKSNIAGNWLTDGAGSLNTDTGGHTSLRSFWAQDAWSFAPLWKTVLGLRAEGWRARDGFTVIPGAAPAVSNQYASRSENYFSPKAALSYQLATDSVLKGSLGRAVRMPTVSELYGNTSTTNSRYINDPNLRPERSVTSELSWEKDFGNSLLRVTLFSENVNDSLFSQTTFDATAGVNVTRVQNVGRIQTNGWELAFSGTDVLKKGLDLQGSLTYADSRVKENKGFVTTAGDTIGKYQPRVPVWRATAVATYRFDDRLSATYAARYSGSQFSTLNNSDPNGFAYQGSSKYFTTDLRVRYKIDKQWTAAFGIDNLNNYQYWNFHPYPQRSYNAELKFDL